MEAEQTVESEERS